MSYLSADIQEEILIRLPLKSILRFKTISKQWKSVLESRSFAERRIKLEKKPKILAVGDHRTESRFEDDAEEIEVVYLHCDDAAKRPSLTCDGLVCIPVPGWVNVLNPSTGEFISFPSEPLTEVDYLLLTKPWSIYPGFCAMGFGKDKIDGHYKIVRLFSDPTPHCEILDVHIGEWRRNVNMPPNSVDPRSKSVYANGSIYWLHYWKSNILALDLHTEEFRSVQVPPIRMFRDQLVNLEDRLGMVIHYVKPNWTLEIWIIDALEETWTMAYNIHLDLRGIHSPLPRNVGNVWFRTVAVSKKGNVFFCDNEKRLFKYDPETDNISCLSSDICVISDFVENLVSLRLFSGPKISECRSGFQYQDHVEVSEPTEKFGWIKKRIPNIWIATTLSVVFFSCFSVGFRSRN